MIRAAIDDKDELGLGRKTLGDDTRGIAKLGDQPRNMGFVPIDGNYD